MIFRSIQSIIAILALSHIAASATASTSSEYAVVNDSSIQMETEQDANPFKNYKLSDTHFAFNPLHATWLQEHRHREEGAQWTQTWEYSKDHSGRIEMETFRGISYTQEQLDEVAQDLDEYDKTRPAEISLDTPLKDAFITHCADYLLSDTVLEDDKLSQVESTNFLQDYCIQSGVCEPDFTVVFHALDFRLQLAFTRFNCPLDLPSDQECLDELDKQGSEFGKIIENATDPDLRQDVVDYCSWLWHFGSEYHGGTESPTMSPTGLPTVSPTASPTSSPSASPSSSPSKGPTTSPTSKPSLSPSSSPTAAPNASPSGSPTKGPSASPTSNPSSSPSSSPTALPSASPSDSPTMGPSASPTVNPTEIPSPSPTALPSASPSDSPSIGPSASPTVKPTEIPSPSPSRPPTEPPTAQPTVTSSPTISGTSSPTSSPTVAPTSMHSDLPSLTPSASPTSTPSSDPSSVPSDLPSLAPSASPTSTPSSDPSSVPSDLPSLTPSASPTSTPSSDPSSLPSDLPSLTPSASPTSTPSSDPSSLPSDLPSLTPSASPTSTPSSDPSSLPSDLPSLTPSASPTSTPSSGPSSKPSTMPSLAPSPSPSESPSMSPSSKPTSLPSLTPSSSRKPTSAPSSHPTIDGTLHPTISAAPSSSPTSAPTKSPTGSPSGTPTQVPTTSPTLVPNGSPSSRPTDEPTDEPTIAPTYLPSSITTFSPTTRPTFIPREPSSSPSSAPTAPPTISHVPSSSVSPSQSPTSTVPFRASFTYILGFNDTEISARSLDDANQDVFIMDDMRTTVYKVLALGDINRRRNLRKLISFKAEDPYDAIRHKNLIDEDECPESFTESASCVRVVTEVLVRANPDSYDEASVSKEVNEPINESMSSDLFIDTTTRKEVKEVKYLGPGTVNEDEPLDPNTNRGGLLNGSGIAGIAVGSVFVVFAIALFAFSRSRAEDDRDDESPDSSDVSDGIDVEMETPDDGGGKTNLPSIGGTNSFEAISLSRAAQFDPETGGVIPPVVSEGSNGSSSSSMYGSSDDESELLIGRLDAAVSAGDWTAVAAIAGDLSSADEASTFSSTHSVKVGDGNRGDLFGEDATRAANIDKLIAEGDWNAVGATAAAFDSGASSSGSEHVGDTEPNTNIGGEGKKRSILDFIAGPWQSSAASKAIVEDTTEGNVEELNVDGSKTGSDGISSLSNGGSPVRRSPGRRGDIEVPMSSDAFPSMQPPIESDSSATDDDTKPMVGKKSEKKRSWIGRIPLIRRKENAEEQIASKQLALQEDSSVSSWSRGSPDSPGTAPYADSKPKADENMPAEMRIFGEDHGLAAAELAMRQEEEAKELNASEDISQKSSGSLRDELDKAIESGDWAAVEAQTNKMFDTSIEGLNNELPSIPPRVNTSSSYEEDSDDDSREGWSTSSKSQKSEPIDDERIAMLEKLIETDDWQGIVTTSRIHNRDDSSMASSFQDEGLISLATDREGGAGFEDGEDEDLSLASDTNTNTDNTNNTNPSFYSA